MSRVYSLSKVGVKVLYKIRHHRGHGIHSPFVFNLINHVIEGRKPYYSYNYLSDFITKQRDGKDYKLTKTNKLYFKLINYFNAKQILEIGAGTGANTIFLTAPSSDIKCVAVEINRDKSRQAQILYSEFDKDITLLNGLDDITHQKYDCIVINLDNFNSLSSNSFEDIFLMCHQKSFILVQGIRKNKKQNLVWRRLAENKTRTAVLDLFNIGIIFFDPALSRWDYKISF